MGQGRDGEREDGSALVLDGEFLVPLCDLYMWAEQRELCLIEAARRPPRTHPPVELLDVGVIGHVPLPVLCAQGVLCPAHPALELGDDLLAYPADASALPEGQRQGDGGAEDERDEDDGCGIAEVEYAREGEEAFGDGVDQVPVWLQEARRRWPYSSRSSSMLMLEDLLGDVQRRCGR